MLATANALLPSMIPTKIDDGCEIIEQLKEKFNASTTILTILSKAGVYKKFWSK